MEKITFYTVLENQGFGDGSYAGIHNYYTDQNQAYSAYYTVCAAAVISALPYHAAYMIRSDGIVVESRVFDRRTNEVNE